MKMSVVLTGAVAAAAVCASVPAAAHTDLVGSRPAADSAGPAPGAIVLTFSQKVVPKFTGVDVVSGQGSKAALTTQISADGKVVQCTPNIPLRAGTCRVAWHAVSAGDGHRTQGTFSFRVE